MTTARNTSSTDADAAAVIASARAGEPDRYLAALLSPHPQREALLALAAFSSEIRRIPLAVHEPAMGDIRLQWWRDALSLPPELRSGHPVADAVRTAASSSQLPVHLLETLIDASFPSEDPTGGSEEHLLAWLRQTEGSLFALAGQVLALPVGPDAEAAYAAAGYAYGLARLLMEQAAAVAVTEPAQSRRPALFEARATEIRHNLAQARQFAAGLPRAKRVAFLPLALVESYLRALARAGHRFEPKAAGVAPLTRVCRIAAAHLLGGV